MSRYSGRLPRTYERAVALLKGKKSRNLDMPSTDIRHTFDHEAVPCIVVRHHYTDIAVFYDDGSYEVNSQGYFTSTTKERLNAMVPTGFGFVTRKHIGKLITPGFNEVDGDGFKFSPDGSYSIV